MKRLILIALAAATLGSWPPARADIDLTTLPRREWIQLTIYNSEDITMVRERRSLTFKKGMNRIQFAWAGTLIDPTSLTFRPMEREKDVVLQDTVFPPARADALQWEIQSQVEGPVLCEIAYFTSGITWSAEYAALADADERKTRLKGHVRLLNRSGEEYPDAQVRLIVGNIHLVQKIAELAQRRPGQAFRDMPEVPRTMARMEMNRAGQLAERCAAKDGMAREKGIVKEGIAEYFLFTIEGTETIEEGWAKRLTSLDVNDVPTEVLYRASDRKTGGQVMKFYRLRNEKVEGQHPKANLGEAPLPNGSVRVFSENGKRDLAYVGATQMAYVPVGDRFEWNLGPDSDLLLERGLLDTKRDNIVLDRDGRSVKAFDETFTFRARAHNTRGIPVKLEVEQAFPAGFRLDESTVPMETVDKDVLRCYLDLAPGEERSVTYIVTVHHGN